VLIAVFVLGAVWVAGCDSAGVRATRAESAETTPDTAPATTTPQPDQSRPPGSGGDLPGVGDELFPELGSPSVDVRHYDIDLTYDAASDHIEGAVTLDLSVTDDVDVVHLDSDGPVVDAVTVDGVDASFDMVPGDLAIDLPTPLSAGSDATVRVEYSAEPRGGAGSIGLPSGWFNTPGGSYTLNEPDGAHSWLPCNDHPSDKATYTFRITVAPGVTAVANGGLEDHTTSPAGETWVWQEERPMTTYLIQVLTGDYEVIDGVGPHGLPLVHAVFRSDVEGATPLFDLTVQQIDFFEQWFGPYPLDRYGLAITDSESGLAMETQERSLFSRDDLLPGPPDYMQHLLLSHELTHQWFGDAVSPARWSDIWLNESFATYGQWMWMEHAGFGSVESSAAEALRTRPPGSSARPTVDGLFGFNSYDGGAVVLHALRRTIGDDAFFSLLRRWVAEYNGTSRTTEEFIAMADDESGTDLGEFFDTWLFAVRPPARFP
jgi:aminopeptidase N